MGTIRLAIAGVGNCASSLVQGVEYYKNAKDNETIPGLMHARLGGYHIRDIEFTLGVRQTIFLLGSKDNVILSELGHTELVSGSLGLHPRFVAKLTGLAELVFPWLLKIVKKNDQ